MKDSSIPSPRLSSWLEAIDQAMVSIAEELDALPQDFWFHPEAERFFGECQSGLALLDSLLKLNLLFPKSLSRNDLVVIQHTLLSEGEWLRTKALTARYLFRNDALGIPFSVLAGTLEDFSADLKIHELPKRQHFATRLSSRAA